MQDIKPYNRKGFQFHVIYKNNVLIAFVCFDNIITFERMQ